MNICTSVKDGKHQDEQQGVLDASLLFPMLPPQLWEEHILPYYEHKYTSKEGLMRDIDLYVKDPTTFNYPIGHWDVSGITDFSHVFDVHYDGGYRAWLEGFNEPLSGWDVSNATNFSDMFRGCRSFNQELSSWDVSNAVDLSSMFCGCLAFDGEISSWNVSNATNLSSMFSRCSSFSQDLSTWNVSYATNLSLMFYECSSFNQDLSSWNVSAISRSLMFYGCTGARRMTADEHFGLSALFRLHLN